MKGYDLGDRRTYLGGSELAAVFNVSSWDTPYSLWTFKVGLAPPKEQNEAMLWGHLNEPGMVQEAARRIGARVVEYPGPELVHPAEAWMRGHPDAMVETAEGTVAMVEAKNVDTRWTEAWYGEDGPQIPLMYRLQAQWNMGLWNLSRAPRVTECLFAVLLGGNRLVDPLPVETFHPEFFDTAMVRARDFWRCVTDQVPPPDLNPGDDLALMYPQEDPGKTVAAGPELAAVVEALAAAEARLRELKNQQDQVLEARENLRLRIQSVMQDAERITFPDGSTATWKDQVRKAYQVQESRSRVFRVSWGKALKAIVKGA